MGAKHGYGVFVCMTDKVPEPANNVKEGRV